MNFWSVSARTPSGESCELRLAQGDYSIGSGTDATIRAYGEGVTHQHAVLILRESRLEIRLLNAHRETSVNGRSVAEMAVAEYPAVLQVGETIVEVKRFNGQPAEELTQIIRRFDPRSVAVKPEEVWEQTIRIKRSGAGGKGEDIVELKHASAHEQHALAAEEGAEFESATLHLDMKPAEFFVERSAWVQMAYCLKGEIARGGMGRIFAAEDPLLGCDVAVKVSTVHAEGGDKQFEREARVLAHLAHPNIVPVHAMGVNPQGLPFYSMKLVRGKTLQSILKEQLAGNQETLSQYPLDRLLTVFRKICDGVGFAHSKGFLHRDLKPENVMSGEFGEVLVMDWGLALPLKGNSWGATQMAAEVQHGEEASLCIEGTPQYMSPEQAEGQVLDERSDIYALGGVLYSILTKRAPVQGRNLEEVLTKVRSGAVSPMTTRRTPLPSGGQRVLGALDSGAPQALRAVTMKALARDPDDRYGSVAELAADVEAFQNGFATQAEKAGFLRQWQLWMMRHRAASGLIFLLVLGAILFTVRLAASEKQAHLSAWEATENAKKAQDSATEARDNLAEAEYNAQRAETNSQKALEEKEHARKETARAQIALAEAAEQDLNAEVMRRVLEKVPNDLRTQEWHYLQTRTDSSDLTIHAKTASPWLTLMPHPREADVFITIQADGWVRRLNLGTGAAEDLFKLDVVRLDRGATLSADGERLALARGLEKQSSTGPQRQQIEVYPLKQPESPLIVAGSWQFTGAPTDLKFSPDGRFLLRTPRLNRNESVALVDSHSGALLWERVGEGICVTGFSEESRVVYIYSERNGLVLLDAMNGNLKAPILPPNEQPTKASVFAYSGVNERISASKNWGALFELQGDLCRKIDPKSGKSVFSNRLPTGRLSSNLSQMSYVKESDSLATISPKSETCGSLQLWNATNGYLIRALPLYMERKGSEEWGILTHPVSGQVVVTRGFEMKVWKPLPTLGELAIKLPLHVVGFTNKPGFVLQSSFANPRDSRTALELRLLNLREVPPVPLAGVSFPGVPDRRVSMSKNGIAACVKEGPLLRIYEIQDDGQILEVSAVKISPLQMNLALISPSGHRFWCWDGVFDARSGEMLVPLNRKGIMDGTGYLAGHWLNSSRVLEIVQMQTAETHNKKTNLGRTLLLWNTETGAIAAKNVAPEAMSISAPPDGSLIAEGGSDMRVRIRNGTTLEVERQFRAHDEALTAVAWHPTLPLLATAAEDYTIKIWDLRTDTLLETISHPTEFLNSLSWSPDGDSLLATEVSGYVYVFSPASLKARSGK